VALLLDAAVLSLCEKDGPRQPSHPADKQGGGREKKRDDDDPPVVPNNIPRHKSLLPPLFPTHFTHTPAPLSSLSRSPPLSSSSWAASSEAVKLSVGRLTDRSPKKHSPRGTCIYAHFNSNSPPSIHPLLNPLTSPIHRLITSHFTSPTPACPPPARRPIPCRRRPRGWRSRWR
jgi:hypothetical protein